MIHENDIRLLAREIFDGLLGRLDQIDCQAVTLQYASEKCPGRARVIDNQRALLRHGTSRMACAHCGPSRRAAPVSPHNVGYLWSYTLQREDAAGWPGVNVVYRGGCDHSHQYRLRHTRLARSVPGAAGTCALPEQSHES